MEKDKELQSLLTKYALQEPSEKFNERVMHLITKPGTKHITSLTSGLLQRVLLIIFITVTIALLITSFFIQPKTLITPLSISLPANIYKQLFSFLGAFWVVMLVNLRWNKRNTIGMSS
jgi:hypothetical protein